MAVADRHVVCRILASNLSGAAKIYSRIVPVVLYLLRSVLAGKTPRKYYASEHKMVSSLSVTT